MFKLLRVLGSLSNEYLYSTAEVLEFLIIGYCVFRCEPQGSEFHARCSLGSLCVCLSVNIWSELGAFIIGFGNASRIVSFPKMRVIDVNILIL
jgi:hypothetical protein